MAISESLWPLENRLIHFQGPNSGKRSRNCFQYDVIFRDASHWWRQFCHGFILVARILNMRTVWVTKFRACFCQTFPPIGKHCPATAVQITELHLVDLPVLSMKLRFECILFSGKALLSFEDSPRSRSSVDSVSDQAADWMVLGSNPFRGKRFLLLCSVFTRGSFPETKLSERDVDHPPTSSSKIENEWSYASTWHPCILYWFG